jgi:Tol biopolymer transport system component
MRRIAGATVGVLIAIMWPGTALAAPVGAPVAVDQTIDGSRPNDRARGDTAVSADGRYVAFDSFASNIVAGDTNGWLDVFVRDTVAGTTTLVSVSSTGVQGNHPSMEPAISADGRYVVFSSSASNLVPDDSNDALDVFVRDLQAGTTTRVSVSAAGKQGRWRDDSEKPAISADGRYVGFESDAQLVPADTDYIRDIYVYDLLTGTPERISQAVNGQPGNSDNFWAHTRLSAHGDYVVWASAASNLVSGDTNGKKDVFVRDRRAQRTTIVSVAADGLQGDDLSEQPAISGDARYVAFSTVATNLGDATQDWGRRLYVKSLETGELTREDRTAAGSFVDGTEPQLSADGRYLAMTAFSRTAEGRSGSTNVYVRDRQTGTLTPASHGVDGTPAKRTCLDVALSADGRHVTFDSDDGSLGAGDTDGTDNIFVTDLGS